MTRPSVLPNFFFFFKKRCIRLHYILQYPSISIAHSPCAMKQADTALTLLCVDIYNLILLSIYYDWVLIVNVLLNIILHLKYPDICISHILCLKRVCLNHLDGLISSCMHVYTTHTSIR